MISSEKYFSINLKAIWEQLKREPLHFWLLCGYLFVEYVRPQSIYPAIDVVPWAKLVVIGALISSLTSGEAVPSGGPLAKLFWGLLITVFFSSLFAEFPGAAFSQINVVLNWVIIYYLFIRIVTTKFRFFVVMLLIMLFSYKMSQHAAISWAKRGFAYERWGIAGTPGFFGNAADLGVQMLIMLPLSIVFIRQCRNRWGSLKKLFFYLFPVTALMTIVATGERSQIIGLGAVCLTAALSARRRVRNIILAAVFAICFISVMPQGLFDRFTTIGKDNTSLSRLTYWKRGVEFFEGHPFLGIGYNNWVPYYAKYHPGESLRSKEQEVAHSTPLTVLAELGILGLIFYYGIVLKTILINFRSMDFASANPERIWRDIPFALNIGIAGFLTASIFISITFYPFLFIQASLSASLYNLLARENQEVPVENENIVAPRVRRAMLKGTL